MGGESMVFHKENGKIMSGGMTISSILMERGTPISFSCKADDADPVRAALGRGVVPAGLVVLQDHFSSLSSKPTGIKLQSQPMDESMVERLYGMREDKPKGRKTKTRRSSGRKKTRKQK